jgi:hypothetical protein
MASERASQQTFFGVSALLFVASAAATIVWCASMSAMGEMPMPGGWTMAMAWMRMPGQTWPGAGSCTATLRIMPSPPKWGKMPPSQDMLEGARPWGRLIVSLRSSCVHACGSVSSCPSPGPSAR